MHELSIAGAIVAIAEEHAGGRRVAKVQVKIGHLRQIVPGALIFAFELVTLGTSVEGAKLEIEAVPVRVACRSCQADSRLDEFPFACPRCGSVDVGVKAGDELFVDALELVDQERAPSGVENSSSPRSYLTIERT
jgi:hydrogenase nickel incorporation protein HypA/HybF